MHLPIRVAFAVCATTIFLTACGGGHRSNTPQVRAGTLQLGAATLSVAETAGTATVRVTRTGGSDGAVSVTVASSNGSANSGSDYTALSTTVNFAAGDTAEKMVTVPITDDAEGEQDETLTVTLSAPTGGATLGATTATGVTITDNDPPSAPALALAADIKQLLFTWPAVTSATSYQLFRDPDGAQGFSRVGSQLGASATSTSLDVVLYRHDWMRARYRLDACNANGCSSSTVQSALPAMLDAIGYFKSFNTGEADVFGSAVALSADGTVLAIGAPGEGSSAGAVYVFTRIGGSWAQQPSTAQRHHIRASNTEAGDNFGTAVALSADGNTLAIGASGEDSSGAAYVFTRTGTSWTQQSSIKASNPETNDLFGSALALSADGNTLAVTAPGDDSDAGAVYVFTRTTASWTQQARVRASNPAADDRFGAALGLSADGNTLAVGAKEEDSAATGADGDGQSDNSAADAGAVYVFARSGASWSQQAYVKASNTNAFDLFGSALALSGDGNTLAVAAYGEASSATGIAGNSQDNSVANAGAVYVFTRAAAMWSQQAYVKASNTGENDFFGWALGLSADGSTLAVSAAAESSASDGIEGDQHDDSAANAGAVYMFVRSGSQQWSQLAYLKAANSEADDVFGIALALSSDGDTLAVGADDEDSAARDIHGNPADNSVLSAGAVYLY
jgi:trimeric autotransporter adhesin